MLHLSHRRFADRRCECEFLLNLMAQVTNSDLSTMFTRVIQGVTEYFHADHACIHLSHGDGWAEPVRRAALQKCPVQEARPEDLEPMVRAEALLIQRCLSRGCPVTLNEARDAHAEVRQLTQTLRLQDGMSIPLSYQGELYGVLNLYARKGLPHFDPQSFTALGAVLYGAVKREIMLKWLRERDETVDTLARLVEARDPYTGGHAERVRAMARRLGELQGLAGQDLRDVERAALLHDIGKVGVPDSILHKPGRLDPDERRIMERHTTVGREILSSITDPAMATVVAGVTWHHERPDGKGYPDGLPAAAIPLVARIIAVADTFDAMVSERPYRPAMPLHKALAILQEVRGTQLDPELVDLLLAHAVWREALPQQEAPTTSPSPPPPTAPTSSKARLNWWTTTETPGVRRRRSSLSAAAGDPATSRSD